MYFLARPFELFDVEPNLALFGELHRIVHAVRQDLTQAHRIADQILRDTGRDVHQELEPLVVRLLRRQRGDRTDDVVEPEVGGFEV